MIVSATFESVSPCAHYREPGWYGLTLRQKPYSTQMLTAGFFVRACPLAFQAWVAETGAGLERPSRPS